MPLPSLTKQEPEIMSALDLARLLFHGKWKILSLTLSCGVIAALYAYVQPVTYSASATVLIEPRHNRAVQLADAYDPGIETDNYLLTQLGVIKSRALVEKVMQRLDLTKEPEFRDPVSSSFKDFWTEKIQGIRLPFLPESDNATLASKADARDASEVQEQVYARFMANLSVLPMPRTQLIQINFVAHSPRLAASVANALADAYIEHGLEARLETSKKATQWLTEKLADIRVSYEKSEQNLQSFREKQQIINVGGTRGLLGDELVDNSQRLREAQRRRTELSSSYTKIQEAGNEVRKLEQISDLIRLPLVQGAKTNLLTALESLKQLQQRYGEKHPLLSSAITRVEAAERTFRDQLLLAAQNVRTEYELARQNERVLGATVETQKEQIRALDRKEYEQSVLEREVSSNKQLYDVFLSSFKATDTASSYEPINVRILEAAVPPSKRHGPIISSFAIKGTAVGFILGIILILMRQFLDETLHTPEELESISGLPVISVIPKVMPGIGSRKSLVAMFTENPRTPFAESIRSIRASLKLNDVDRSYKRVLVTSAVPGEGKSNLASCLTLAFSAGEKALLIECDLRAPTIKKLFDLPKDRPGLMELLTGEATLDECLYLHEPTQAYVLAVAKSPANPAEVINSAAFLKLITSLSERFDHVVLDSPPCQAASDSLVLAKMVDVVLFTTMADSTNRRAVVNALKQLKQVQAHIVGCILNQVDARKSSYYADSYYYARQYYG